jgi:hypothetical protein
MGPTRPTNLILTAVLTAAVAYLFMRRYFGSVPDLTWLAGLAMAALAVVEGVAARSTRAKIERRPGAGALNPLFVARLVVLAKASSLAGALFAGVYGGVTVWALSERGQLQVAAHNLVPAAVGLVGALVLIAAGLALEHACRVPKPPDEERAGGSDGRSTQ